MKLLLFTFFTILSFNSLGESIDKLDKYRGAECNIGAKGVIVHVGDLVSELRSTLYEKNKRVLTDVYSSPTHSVQGIVEINDNNEKVVSLTFLYRENTDEEWKYIYSNTYPASSRFEIDMKEFYADCSPSWRY